MGKDDTQKDADYAVWKTTADILGRHGKSDAAIKEMLAYHFRNRQTGRRLSAACML